jgi:hypothetical protein
MAVEVTTGQAVVPPRPVLLGSAGFIGTTVDLVSSACVACPRRDVGSTYHVEDHGLLVVPTDGSDQAEEDLRPGSGSISIGAVYLQDLPNCDETNWRDGAVMVQAIVELPSSRIRARNNPTTVLDQGLAQS